MKIKLPNWVEIYREKGKTIKERNGKYYLYEVKTIYDKTKKYKHKTQNIYLGRITEDDGLIPPKLKETAQLENIYTKNIGSYCLFNFVGKEIMERLKKYFGELAEIIFVIACLRCQENTVYSELEDIYIDSYFSAVYKNLSMSKTALSDFLVRLSKYKTNMNLFMREDIENDDILIFDGTNLLCGSHNISYMGYGYKHGHNYGSQINELYAYSAKNKKPVYYKLLEGSVSDRATLEDVMEESGIKSAIALIDNGFESESNLNSLLINKNQYIMALRRESKLVPEEILHDYGRINSDTVFLNNGESIYAYEKKDEENNRICIYFNKKIEEIETSEYLTKIMQKIKGYSEEGRKKAQERFRNICDKN